MSVDRALRPDFRGLLRGIVISIVIPAVLVQILIRVGVSLIDALAIAAIFPLGAAIYGWTRRQVDVIAVIGLLFIAVGVATSYVSTDARYALVAGSLGSAIFGAVCLLSLLARRPAMFAIAKGAAGSDAYATFDKLWEERPAYRTGMRLITAVWGLGLLGEAALRVAIVYVLDPRLTAIVSPVLDAAAIIALMLWTVVYVRNARRRAGAG
ncbi:MAG: VC0807 family protein [Candidatus Aquilonibacter sp.]|jgi:hypothetical protein